MSIFDFPMAEPRFPKKKLDFLTEKTVQPLDVPCSFSTPLLRRFGKESHGPVAKNEIKKKLHVLVFDAKVVG